jgi:hypothetical protein
MPYVTDMEEAASRHYQDGCKLLEDNRLDNAGYHFGLAAECAVKRKLQSTGLRNDADALWAHFPTVKALALQAISGRSAAPLRKLLERGNFMQGRDVKMRYARNGAIDRHAAERWRDHANEAIGLLP